MIWSYDGHHDWINRVLVYNDIVFTASKGIFFQKKISNICINPKIKRYYNSFMESKG